MAPQGDEIERAARRASRVFLALVFMSSALVVLGALVRAHGAGLACPDWPLCFGQLVPALNLSVGLEWGHRALAGAVSLGLVGAAVLVLRNAGLRARVGRPLTLAFGVLAVQVVLGGLTVLLGLAPWTVVAHLLMGTGFCAVLLWISRDLAEVGSEARAPVSGAAAALVGLCAAAVVVQIGLGGMVSSHYAGLACAAFPTCDGESLAPSLSGLVGLAVLHRIFAVFALVSFGALCWVTRARVTSWRLAWLALRLLILQVAVGALNVLMKLPVEVTAFHSALALSIALVTLLLVRDFVYARSPRAATRALAGRGALGALG